MRTQKCKGCSPEAAICYFETDYDLTTKKYFKRCSNCGHKKNIVNRKEKQSEAIKNILVTKAQLNAVLRATSKTAKYNDYLGQSAIQDFDIEAGLGGIIYVSYSTAKENGDKYFMSTIRVHLAIGVRGGKTVLAVSEGFRAVAKKYFRLYV